MSQVKNCLPRTDLCVWLCAEALEQLGQLEAGGLWLIKRSESIGEPCAECLGEARWHVIQNRLDEGALDGKVFWAAFKRGHMRPNAAQALRMITVPALAGTGNHL